MSLRIRAGTVQGRLRAPSSKSHTHRALILAALSGNGLVRHALASADTQATLDGLGALGYMVTHESGGVRVGGVTRGPKRPVDAHESGTTLRLLVPVASLQDKTVTFQGSRRLGERPMQPLLAALRSLGVQSTADPAGFPITVTGPLQGGTCDVTGDVSSQFLSGLLMATPVAPRDTDIRLSTALVSRPYVDITLAQLRLHGVSVREDRGAFHVPGNQTVRQKPFDVPGDWSSAAFLLAAAAITGGRVQLEGLELDDPQGDRAILDHLAAFGARVQRSPEVITVEGGPLDATDVDVGATPDLFPILGVIAACARGASHLKGAPHLRHKESDRIAATADLLKAFGVRSEPQADGLIVYGSRARAAQIPSHNDHRIAMSGAVLALAAAGGESTLPDPQVISKSYPGFQRDLSLLRAEVTA